MSAQAHGIGRQPLFCPCPARGAARNAAKRCTADAGPFHTLVLRSTQSGFLPSRFAPPSSITNSLRPIRRVPDAVQRPASSRDGAPLIRDHSILGVWNDPRKSGSPELRAITCRCRASPRSVSAAHHSALRAPCCTPTSLRSLRKLDCVPTYDRSRQRSRTPIAHVTRLR